MSLTITPFFIGLFAVMQVPITVMVGYRRLQTGVPFFDGGDQTLMRRMRAHEISPRRYRSAFWQWLPLS